MERIEDNTIKNSLNKQLNNLKKELKKIGFNMTDVVIWIKDERTNDLNRKSNFEI